ncbi:MAG: hypothetical protein ACJASR_002615 [Psychroserpens sp.]|jgi:hypothetical protein
MNLKLFVLIYFTISFSASSCQSKKEKEKMPYIQYSKFLQVSCVISENQYSVQLFQTWKNGDYVKSKGVLTAKKNVLSLSFDNLFNNHFDLINSSIIDGDTNIIHWDFIPRDSNFIKSIFRVYKNANLSDTKLLVITLEDYGLLEISDNYNIVFDSCQVPIGEFVTNGYFKQKELIIHTEGVIPDILSDTSLYIHKRIL